MNQLTTPTHAEVLGELYTAVAVGDLDAAAARLHPDVVLHVPGDHPAVGEHRGRSAFLDFVAASTDEVGGHEQLTVVDVLAGADHAAALCDVVGIRDGEVALRNRTVHLFRVEDGLVRDLWFHNWDQGAVDRFWS